MGAARGVASPGDGVFAEVAIIFHDPWTDIVGSPQQNDGPALLSSQYKSKQAINQSINQSQKSLQLID
jgi:hypothetical protein